MSRYPGYYLTGDGGYLDQDGYLFVMGRIATVANSSQASIRVLRS